MSTNPTHTPDPATLANELDEHGLLKPRRGLAAGRGLYSRLHPDPATTDDHDQPGSTAAGRDLYAKRHHGGTK